jgi:hypothetical protein
MLLSVRIAALLTSAALAGPTPALRPTSVRAKGITVIPESTVPVRGVVRDVVGVAPNLRGMQALSRAQAAKLLGVEPSDLLATERISPAAPVAAHAHMRLYCPSYVRPDSSTAGFFPSDGPACGSRTGAGLRFSAKKGRRYLIDCAGSPGNGATWRLRPSGTTTTTHAVANTEHPAFLFDATADGDVALDFNADAPAFQIHFCEITAADAP